VGAGLRVGLPGDVVVDDDRLAGCADEQLGLAGALHRREPVHGLLHAVAHREEPVVAEDDGLRLAERVGQALALLDVEDDAGEVVEQRVVLEEDAAVLGERGELLAERRERLAVDRVAVRRGDDVGPGRVDLRVDRERSLVDRGVALDHLAAVVDADQVVDADHLEVHPERVDPEPVRVLRVADGDVAGHALVEPEPPEQAERGGEALLQVESVLLDVRELGDEAGQLQLGRGHAGKSTSQP
jgi:hypothetical protein